MSIRIDNNTFELKITPNKRKRELSKDKHHNKENNFIYNNFMEVKSISDLVQPKCNNSINENPYELVRKPPKKKTKHDLDFDENCFVNPALNINGPEKQINPFEVKRAPIAEEENHCFSNAGLNIRGADREINPFEIVREEPPPKKEIHGIENPCLELQPTLVLGVPFTPTVGCRIDFNNVPLEALTPCSMLNNKLVFSPIKKPADLTPKRQNLSVISEEAVDISKELESYQLELENSMNEAKASKKRGNKNLMDIKRKNTFIKRLTDSIEEDRAKEKLNQQPIESVSEPEHYCQDSSDGHSECPKSSTPKTPNENCIAKYPLDKSINENPDVVYEEVEETHIEIVVEQHNMINEPAADAFTGDKYEKEEECEIEKEIEFKNPAPFVRTYRRDVRRPAATLKSISETSKESNEEKPKEQHEMFGGIRSSIRKSIRKLMHPHSGKSKSSEDVSAKDTNTPSSSTNILSSIRHSLRRKQPKQPLATSTPCDSLHDISIIDNCKPRAVFKDVAIDKEKVIVTNAGDGEDFAGGSLFRSKTTIRSSFRKSSRHVMKSVFNKNIEDYDLGK